MKFRLYGIAMPANSQRRAKSPGRSFTMKKRALVTLDVFTDRALTGNALAVCLDGRGLTTEQMQSIARETNLSETTFILPGEAAVEKAAENDRGIRVRIFTIQEELPFAGHPTLGTAYVLHQQTGASDIRLELNVGTVPVHFEKADGQPVFGEMTQNNPTFLQTHAVDSIAPFTKLNTADFDTSVPIQTVSTGLPFTIAAVRSLEKMRGLRVDVQRVNEYLARTGGGKFLYFVTREAIDPQARLHARMFFYNGEDPATGSAAGCCASWMVAHGVAASDERVMIEQGVEMHRPSRIFVCAQKKDNQVINVRVGGNCVEVLRGELTLAD
jgi:trans-2,3-dihydro-3-hydroxyanthranilate isomerase